MSLVLSTGLLPKPGWKFWGKARDKARQDTLLSSGRRIAAEYGHQIAGWNTSLGAGDITPNIHNVALEVERAFTSIKPDVVWAPAFLGLDPDYDATNVIASRLPRLTTRGVELYEYIPRPLVRSKFGAGMGRGHMVFPSRLGMELTLNLTVAESAKRLVALDGLQKIYDEDFSAVSDREIFRLLPDHNYAKPPYGYKNAAALRGSKLGGDTVKTAVTAYLRLQKAPINRAALSGGDGA